MSRKPTLREQLEACEEAYADARMEADMADAYIKDLRRVIADGIEAFRFTREYVDPKGGDPKSTDGLLPAIHGWSWFDWCADARYALGEPEPVGA